MPYRNPEKPPTQDEARAALRRAETAAKDGQASVMIEELAESGYLDGLVRRVRARWGKLDDDACDDVVADAVGKLYRKVQAGGGLVEKPDRYLSKAVFGLAHDEWQRRSRGREAAEERARLGESHDGDEASQDVLRQEAIRVARGLLSHLGQENVQRVMEMVLDHVEALEPIENTVVADALGLTPNHVAKLIERGIERLARVAEEQGHTLSIDYALAVEDGAEEEEH